VMRSPQALRVQVDRTMGLKKGAARGCKRLKSREEAPKEGVRYENRCRTAPS
jgi:hypothetical protein